MSRAKTVRGVSAPVFPIDMLVVTKYMASRDDAKDWLDIYALYQRGAFSIKQISKRLKQMGHGNEAVAFEEFMQRLQDMRK